MSEEKKSESAITIIAPRNLAETKQLADMLAPSQMIPQALQKRPADVMAAVMAGAELGFAPMQALRSVHIINGRVMLAAEAMAAIVKGNRAVCAYMMIVHSDAKKCTVKTQRVGDPGASEFTFTMDEARQAGLLGKRDSNWEKYPAAMLRARAISTTCKAVYPDLLLGVYDPDEVEAVDVTPTSPTPVASTRTEALGAALAARKVEENAEIAAAAREAATKAQSSRNVERGVEDAQVVEPRSSPPKVEAVAKEAPANVVQFPPRDGSATEKREALARATAEKAQSDAAFAKAAEEARLRTLKITANGKTSTVTIDAATVEQLETARKTADESLAKNPKATWAGEARAKVALIVAELEARRAKLEAATGPDEAKTAEEPNPFDDAPEPGSDG